MKHITIGLMMVFTAQSANAQSAMDLTENLKDQIVKLAETYEGLGDPDQSKQKTLEVLVNRLIQQNPMPPVKDRISILAGAWKQIWGPYDYRHDNGGVDPHLGIKEIYQVIFPAGYYYNVAPYYPNGNPNKEQIGLLRGQFSFDEEDPNGLRVQFTKYPGVDPRPQGLNLWDLPSLAEAGQLQNEVTIVPTFIVKLFFRGGKLEEVYTDHDLRILYGSSNSAHSRRSIYVMKRVN